MIGNVSLSIILDSVFFRLDLQNTKQSVSSVTPPPQLPPTLDFLLHRILRVNKQNNFSLLVFFYHIHVCTWSFDYHFFKRTVKGLKFALLKMCQISVEMLPPTPPPLRFVFCFFYFFRQLRKTQRISLRFILLLHSILSSALLSKPHPPRITQPLVHAPLSSARKLWVVL